MGDVLKQTSEVIMKLDPNALENMVKEQLRVQIAAVLAGSANALVEKLIEETLNAKVSESGRPGNYSSDNKYTFVSVVCRHAIQEAVSEAIQEWKEANKASIKTAVKRHLAKHKDQWLEKFAEQSAEAIGRSVVYPSSVHVHLKD